MLKLRTFAANAGSLEPVVADPGAADKSVEPAGAATPAAGEPVASAG